MLHYAVITLKRLNLNNIISVSLASRWQVAAYTDINAGGYLPIALPAENSDLAEPISEGDAILEDFLGDKVPYFFLKTTNRTGLDVHEMRFEWLISTTRYNQVILE